jgi:pimeloyl-ACP methyl ester carboxylesterase
MSLAPTLVLLPGLDGTGDLFAPLIARAQGAFDTRVLRYDHELDQSFARQSEALAPELPTDRDYVLVAESFGGPLALRLAARQPPHLSAVVLVCSFASSPLSLSQRLVAPAVARALPSSPPWVVRKLLAGDDAPDSTVDAVRAALSKVPPHVLRARFATLATCDETEAYLRCWAPMFYLQATRDRLLPASALARLEYLRPGLVVERIDAPHLLLQRAPDAALVQLSHWLLGDKQRA